MFCGLLTLVLGIFFMCHDIISVDTSAIIIAIAIATIGVSTAISNINVYISKQFPDDNESDKTS